jgi:hypothetical protein
MLALQLCVTAHALLLAQHLRRTRRCRGGARTTSGVVRRTFALGASSFWRTWRPHAHHFSADSLFHGLPMCSVFREANQKATSTTKSSFPHCILISLALASFFFALEFIREQTNTTPPYTYGLGKVDTTSGSEHTTRQNRTEVKPDGAREIRWGEGAGVALCGCGRPLSGDGGGQGVSFFSLDRSQMPESRSNFLPNVDQKTPAAGQELAHPHM